MQYKDFKSEITKKYWIKPNVLDIIVWNELFLEREKVFLLSEIMGEDIKKIKKKLLKYRKGYPLEYIVGKAEFMWNDFFVNHHVLIPRSDTEIIVQASLKDIEQSQQKITLFDIWTWSWIIPITLNLLSSNIEKTFCFDISKKALDVTKINISHFNMEENIFCIYKNFSYLPSFFKKEDFSNKSLIFTANLPYIKENDYENMDNSVYTYEPKIALYGWKNTWFELYEKLIYIIFSLHTTYWFLSCILFIEIWFDQKEVSFEFLKNMWVKFEYFADTNKIDRVIKITF